MNIKEQLDETKQELYDKIIAAMTDFQIETGMKIESFSFRNSTYDNFPYVTAVGMILVLEK